MFKQWIVRNHIRLLMLLVMGLFYCTSLLGQVGSGTSVVDQTSQLSSDVTSDETSDAQAWLLASMAYDKGNFDEAAKLYENLGKNQAFDNGHLLYNLGNSYYRGGKIGYAMASFLAARSCLPRDPDVVANLKLVHSKTTDRLDFSTSKSPALIIFGFLTFKFTSRELGFITALLVGFSSLLWFSSIISSRLRSLKIPGTIFYVISFVVGLNFAISLKTTETWGAVVSATAQVYSGPGQNNAVLFDLHEGAPFVQVEIKDQWAKIELSDGKKGWISKDQMKVY